MFPFIVVPMSQRSSEHGVDSSDIGVVMIDGLIPCKTEEERARKLYPFGPCSLSTKAINLLW